MDQCFHYLGVQSCTVCKLGYLHVFVLIIHISNDQTFVILKIKCLSKVNLSVDLVCASLIMFRLYNVHFCLLVNFFELINLCPSQMYHCIETFD